MSISDPFISVDRCADRLYEEWVKHPKLIVAVDFDSTVYDYTDEDYTFTRVLRLLRQCQALDFYIVVFTASDPSRFNFITQYLLEKGIVISSINKNPIQLPFGNHGKIYYNILLDDRAGMGSAIFTLDVLFQRIQRNKEKLVDETNKVV